MEFEIPAHPNDSNHQSEDPVHNMEEKDDHF